jgi:hypothetical protein
MHTLRAVPTPVSGLVNKLLPALVLAALSAAPALASSITPAEFLLPDITTFDGLNLPFFNDTPFAIDGNSIDTSDQTMRYFVASTCSNECIATDEDLGTMTITLAGPTVRAGLSVGSSAADIHFFDAGNVELGMVSVAGNGTTPVFAGWDAGLSKISSIEVIDTESNSRVVTVDDLTVETAPEPATWLLLLSAVIVVPIAKRRGFRRFPTADLPSAPSSAA